MAHGPLVFNVRELCDVSGKNETLQKCLENVREFYILSR